MSNDWRSAALMECHILVDELAVHVKKEDSTVNISGNLHAYVDSLNQNVKLVYEDDYDKIEIVMRRTQLVSSVERVIQYAMENASEGIFIGPLDNTVSTYCTYRVDEVWYTDSSTS